jgi:integrase
LKKTLTFAIELFERCKPKQAKVVRSFLYRYPLLFFFPINICYSTDKNQIFYCFTGLAYIDVFNLRDSNIRTVFDSTLWIMGKRVKTGVSYRVPLLDIPKMIIEKYRGSLSGGELLPVITNQKMNACLKEIADLCSITKNLSFHVARHTLSKGVSIESVSKMPGHTNIKTTRIYARITDDKIKNDMAMLGR